MQRLADPAQVDQVKPDEYSFRLSIRLETGDARYKDIINTGLWIGSAARFGDEGEMTLHSRIPLIDASDIRCIQSVLITCELRQLNDWHHLSSS